MDVPSRVMLCIALAAAGGCGGPAPSSAAGLAPGERPTTESAAPMDLADPTSPRDWAEPAGEPAPLTVSTDRRNVIASADLLKNGSFDVVAGHEQGIPHWRIPEHVRAALDAGSHDGPRALGVELAGNQNFGAPQTIGEVKGGDYLVRGYLRTRELDGEARLEVQDADGGYKSFVAFTDSVGGTLDWTLVSKEFSVPDHVSALNVFLRRPAGEDAGDETGSVWFDRCELFRLAPAATVNLVRNGSFEWGDNGLSWWRGVPDGVTIDWTSHAVAGDKSLQVTVPHGQNLGIGQGVRVTPGKRYAVTGSVKCLDTTGQARLEVVDVNDGWTSFMACSDSLTGTQDWTALALVFETPAHVEGVNLLLRCAADESAAEGSGTVWFDGYEMYELAE